MYSNNQQQHYSGGYNQQQQHPFQSSASPPPLHHPIPTHPINLIRQGSPAGSNASTTHGRTTSSASSAPRTSISSPPNQQYFSGGGSHEGSTSGYMHQGNAPNQQWNGVGPNPWGINDATAQMGMQFGKSAVMAGQDYVEKNINRWVNIPALKHYFKVNNLYVLKKLSVIVFPWRHRPWSRLVKRSEQSGQMEGYKPPKEDINSPDMYIPVMAFVTYILLTGVVAGMEGRFHPEVLGVTASTAFAIVFCEFLFIKLGCYMLNITSESQLLDLIAYSGYKFVGTILTLCARLILSKTYVWIVFFYTFFATAFFLLRSLKYVVLPESSNASTVTLGQRSRRIQFLFMVAMIQVVFMWILVR